MIRTHKWARLFLTPWTQVYMNHNWTCRVCKPRVRTSECLFGHLFLAFAALMETYLVFCTINYCFCGVRWEIGAKFCRQSPRIAELSYSTGECTCQARLKTTLLSEIRLSTDSVPFLLLENVPERFWGSTKGRQADQRWPLWSWCHLELLWEHEKKMAAADE